MDKEIKYYAHSANKKGEWQPLKDHLQNVANLAKQFAEAARPGDAEFANAAYSAGLLHDLGKYADRFQQRLNNQRIHGINHWAAGGVVRPTGLGCYAVDGHHTGLPAFGSLRDMLNRSKHDNHWRELSGCSETITELLARFDTDRLSLPAAPTKPPKDNFANALLTRLLFSCLVDADFLDTERHFDSNKANRRVVPMLQAEDALLVIRKHHADLDAKPEQDRPINQLRRRLLADCFAAAEKMPGLFTLTAPTGSGKTLSSLAFALQHIVHHNASLSPTDQRRFRRIIVVIPYTSIIEQTAKEYRDIFEPSFGLDYVLEHHSAVAPRERPEDQGRDAEDERLRRARLAAENWASPLVVTTSVQFFESLFAHKPSDCRKLHNIADSVVIFDEVQTLPARLVPSLLSAVSLLVRDYKVTALFMTATQPAFASAKAALPYGWEPVEISSNPNALAETMRRTHITLPGQDEKISWSDLVGKLGNYAQTLCVVNTTKDARTLFRLLPVTDRFHLSARMCPAHRQEKLTEIRRRLNPKINLPCRLVSTQLIEAGVDVDFPIAYRAFGPLDSIIQTAGRCNREGRNSQPQPVIVFRPIDGGTPRGAYKTATAKTEEFMARHPAAPLHQPDFYARYFAELYKLVGPDKTDADKVFKLSAEFDFPAASDACRLVGEGARSVLVQWRDGVKLAEKLQKEKHLTSDECRSAQRFSINLYEGEFQTALAQGWVYQPAASWNFFVWNSNYDDNLGACHPDSGDFIH